ncbi:sushi domain-containing protein 4-like [Trichosurus vulpecula]|uniref:sushi domain-containing protein 4-like n=1 Tax=Trichosurus vulpecula TaxID=9337 RepID=UPI00186AEF4F|nr:sushi domain-containing protein 4-like [Trichosurus vulpecula]
MYHGMNPSSGDAFLEQQRQQQQQQPQHQFPPRLFAVVLWFQLALCFGPAQLTGGFDDLRACADPGIPEYGSRTPSGSVFFEDSVARFHCQEGYKLRGPPRRLCMKHLNGSLGWIPTDTPVCLPEGNTQSRHWSPDPNGPDSKGETLSYTRWNSQHCGKEGPCFKGTLAVSIPLVKANNSSQGEIPPYE